MVTDGQLVDKCDELFLLEFITNLPNQFTCSTAECSDNIDARSAGLRQGHGETFLGWLPNLPWHVPQIDSSLINIDYLYTTCEVI